MANPLYARLQATAARLIKAYGSAGKIFDNTASGAEPDPMVGGDPVYPDYDATVVIMAYDARYVNGSTILANDVQIYISAVGLPISPTTGMYVSAGDKTYLIVHMDPNRFDDTTPIVYVCQGRTAA